MADTEMKDASKSAAAEEEKKEEQKVEEPTDRFYGKFVDPRASTVSAHARFCLGLELKKSLVILEKAGKEKDFKTCSSLTK